MQTLVRLNSLVRRLPARLGVVLFALGAGIPGVVHAQFEPGFRVGSPYAILVDYESGALLFAREADAPRPPASLAKLMTMEVVFSEITGGELKLDDELVVSANAWRRGGAPAGGSTMFAAVHSRISVDNLIRGAVIHSGNDACIVFAEALAGNEDQFARIMNGRAHELGLTSAEFRNSTGLHHPAQVISMRDLATLAAHLIRTYPDLYSVYREPEFTWNKIRQQNRNPLLAMDLGADGLKTGYIKESGYGLVGSAVRDGRRLIVALNGAPSEKARADDARRLLEWGFDNFQPRVLFAAGAAVADARVFGGETSTVPLVTERPVVLLVPRFEGDKFLARVHYRGPLRTPVRAGEEVARLRITRGQQVALEAPLYAGASVGQGSLVRRAFDNTLEYSIEQIRNGINSLIKR
jgi:D-alanyl-D-alanine carboxypeptidase (penicillin-binding protein 5/6)